MADPVAVKHSSDALAFAVDDLTREAFPRDAVPAVVVPETAVERRVTHTVAEGALRGAALQAIDQGTYGARCDDAIASIPGVGLAIQCAVAEAIPE
jgi:hypothetical protein